MSENRLPEPIPPRPAADSYMHGGNHYQQVEGEQHWTRIWRLYGRGYFVGCITKYVERYHLKNGIADLEKAIHYIEKLIELETAAAETVELEKQVAAGNVPLLQPGFSPNPKIKGGVVKP